MSESNVLYVTEEGLKKLQDEYNNQGRRVRYKRKAEVNRRKHQITGYQHLFSADFIG